MIFLAKLPLTNKWVLKEWWHNGCEKIASVFDGFTVEFMVSF